MKVMKINKFIIYLNPIPPGENVHPSNEVLEMTKKKIPYE